MLKSSFIQFAGCRGVYSRLPFDVRFLKTHQHSRDISHNTVAHLAIFGVSTAICEPSFVLADSLARLLRQLTKKER